jgi:hypothetical protein
VEYDPGYYTCWVGRGDGLVRARGELQYIAVWERAWNIGTLLRWRPKLCDALDRPWFPEFSYSEYRRLCHTGPNRRWYTGEHGAPRDLGSPSNRPDAHRDDRHLDEQPYDFTYQWNRAGTAVGGATASTYVPVAADVGNTLTVSVVATNSSGASSPATSAATSAVAAAGSVPVNTVLPTIAGTAQVGQTLTATNGTWANSPTSFTYQWNRAGTAIGGATASTYVPVAADVGNTLTVAVIAKNSSGSSAPATSAATSAVTSAGTSGTAARTSSLLGIFGISGHVVLYSDNSQTVSDAQYLGIGKWRDGISGNSSGTLSVVTTMPESRSLDFPGCPLT